MNSGSLNKKIIVQYEAKTRNSFGEEITTWTTLCTIWASVEPVMGNERFLQQERISETTMRFRIRYRSDVDATRRIKYNNRYFNILSVINSNESNKELVIMAKEVI